MEEKSFRVLLDFTKINCEVTDLEYVWMHVSPCELRTILDFKRAVLKKFPFIQETFKLYVRNGLLLENEKIAILREDDTVKKTVMNLGDIVSQNSHTNAKYCTQEFSNMLRLQYEDYTVSDCSIQIPNAENSGRNESLAELISFKETRKRGSDAVNDHEEETTSSSKSHRKKRKREKSHKTAQQEETRVDQELNPDNISEMLITTTEKHKENHVSKTVNQKEIVLDDTSEMANNSLTKKCKKNLSKNISYDNEMSMNSSSSCEKTYKVTELDDSLSTNSKVQNSTVILSNSEVMNNTFEVESVENKPQQENTCKKRKRKRKRKRKESIQIEKSCLVENIETSQNSYAIPKVDQFSNIRKHVIYNSSQPVLTTIKEEIGKTSELSHSSDLKSQSSSGSSSNKTDGHPKVSTPFSRKLRNLESWCITPLLSKINGQTPTRISSGNCSNPNNESAVKIPYENYPSISCMSTVGTHFPNKNGNCSNSNNESAVKTSYDDYPSLSCMPTVGTRLAYKTLELSENYCPEVTEYKEGVVKNVDPKTEELEIELIQEEIKPGRTGKFEILCEDEIPAPQIVKNVTIQWASLIDARLIS